MGTVLDWVLLAIALIQTAAIVALFARRSPTSGSLTPADLDARLDARLAKSDALLRDEFRSARQDQSAAAASLRQELLANVTTLGDLLGARIKENAEAQSRSADALAKTVDTRLTDVQQRLDAQRAELATTLDAFREALISNLTTFSQSQDKKFDAASAKDAEHASALRRELNDLNERLTHALVQRMSQMNVDLAAAWARFSDDVAKLAATVTQNLTDIRRDNGEQLEKMRVTVDEKLHNTLELRLGESFKLVSDRLESVQKGLGEMQALATGVGDLKKVLTNVKTRGTWGEVLLGNLLEQILPPDHYASNVATTGTSERVEYAIKLPGKSDHGDAPVWLPIDSKFPKEDYERLLAAQEAGNPELALASGQALESAIKKFAQDICNKYIETPKTTDFALMFLPSESLYAEVIRRTETVEHLQRHCRVIITGPTTLAALLSSLLMGFRTLAIQKRSSEVWEVLGAVKTEFDKYGVLMDSVQKKLQEAGNTLDKVSTRSRAITKKLRGVEALTDDRAAEVLPIQRLLDDDAADAN